MPWPIPLPGDIASRAASVYESTPALAGIDARNPNTVATVNTRITEMAMQDLYFFQANCARETMPDTANDNLPTFGTEYTTPRDLPVVASGNVIVTGNVGAPVPLQSVFSAPNSSITYSSTAVVNVGTGGTASVPVVASEAGTAGNLAAGSTLTLTSPIENITSLNATVDSNGISGGADLETIEAWRARIIAQIQYEPSGGDYDDYVQWAKQALSDVAMAACPAGACGGGLVSVVIVMTGLVAPTSGQIAAVEAYINNLRPVTATVTVYGVTLNPVNVTLHLNPDTTAIRAAAQAALALSFLQDATIGGTTYKSRLDNAISSSDGEYSHELTAPSADVAAPTLFSLNTLGTVTFV